MNLENMQDAYKSYNLEFDKRRELLKAILTNNEYLNYQQQFIDLYDETNNHLYPILSKMNYEEIIKYLDQSMLDPKYKDLVNFFLILHGYIQLKTNSNNAQKFNEYKNNLYFELLKWYIPNHGVSTKDKEEIVNEFTDTTAESISIRNILANREDLNIVFDNILLKDDLERQIAINAFVTEIDLFLMFVNMYILKNEILGLEGNIPKSIILRLVLMNVLTKEYQLGFRIEEYITRYYNNHDIIKEYFGDNIKIDKRIIDVFIEEILIEINDITNEFMDYKKRKTI